jgi:hypothetical protein
MGYVLDVDTTWVHCDRPATVWDCTLDVGVCGVDGCHAVTCSKCGSELAGYDCGGE